MSDGTVQQIKDRLSIESVVGGYVKLQRAGTILKARCPFHAEKTPSFVVSPERGTYHCFGCNAGGDIFTFVQAIEGLDFKGALKTLAERAGVTLEYRPGEREERDERDRLFALLEAAAILYASRLDDEAKKYLIGRGLSEGTIHSFRLGLAGNDWSDASDHLRGKGFAEQEIIDAGFAKRSERGGLLDKFRNRIMFPIADSAGRVVGFSGRTFGPHAPEGAPKYLNSPETPLFHKSRILYGFDKGKQAIRRHDCAVLVEGQMDLIASHQAGWTNTVAASGTAFTPEHALLIKRMTENLVLALDADEAGIKAAGRAARAALASGLNVKVARLPAGLDPADLIQKEGKDAWSAAIRDAQDIIAFLLAVLAERLPQADRFRRAVESVVLPFIADVSSPIAREQYVHTVASRLGVSEGAVAETLARMPQAPTGAAIEPTASGSPAGKDGPLRHAHALLLWQASLKEPAMDVSAFERDLAACARERAESWRNLPPEEQERLRFEGEAAHHNTSTLALDASAILKKVLDDTLARKRAEAGGDDEAHEALHAWYQPLNRMLTDRIARLHADV